MKTRGEAAGWSSLSLFPTDQILVARWLADRQGCYLHSAGAILDGKGLLFVGHSDAGKTTTVRMLQDQAEILCDDRNIVRRSGDRFRRVWHVEPWRARPWYRRRPRRSQRSCS